MRSRSRSFTLVEMMVAVSILGIGIVLVSRSFLGTLSVLDSMQNRVLAMYKLGEEMNNLEEEALQNKGLKPGQSQEEIELGNRKAVFISEVYALDIEGFSDYVNEVRLNLSWTEGNRTKDTTLVAYIPNEVEE